MKSESSFNNVIPMPKRCRTCNKPFEPIRSSLEVICSPACAIVFGRTDSGKKHRAKARNMEKAEVKERLKTRSDWIKEAQKIFNAYIRKRDKDRPCVSCGTYTPAGDARGGLWDCGHYRSVGSCPELRFEPLNAHKQCKQCNSYLSGNIVEYRIRLRERIGDDQLNWLEGPHPPKKYTIEDLKQIKQVYKYMIKELENG